jgi:predicted nucleic-acid-binding Zn-ribbon protein
MNTKASCFKCGGSEIFTAVVQGSGHGGSILPLGMLNGPKYENKICSGCGYTEWYVEKDSLYLISDKLKKLT